MKHVLSRRALVDHRIDPGCELKVRGDDINIADNVSLSEASSKI